MEIGTFSGYSTLCIASALNLGSKIITYEINDEQEEFTRPWFENSPYANKIEFIIGDAVKLLPKSSKTFQMAFIDGNKRDYQTYYELIFPKMSLGSLIIFDNTLWNNRVADSSHNDAQTQSVRAFNDLVAADRRVESLIIPMRDGLTLLRKVKN